MADKVILLDFWLSPYGMRRDEDLINKSPLLLQMNPIHMKTPVLIHSGKSICESLVAVEYIDEVWNDKYPTLLPSDPYQRAQARFWADFIDKKIYGIAVTLRLWKTGGEEEKEAVKKELLKCLKLLEEELGDKPYFGGDNLGLVDVTLVPMFCWFYTYNYSGRYGFLSETTLPKIIAWAKRCIERECVSKSFPEEHRVQEYFKTRTD